MKRLIIAYKHPCDYASPVTRDELSENGEKRVEILYKRVAQDFFRGRLGRVKILTEAHRLDDMHANRLAGLFSPDTIDITHIVDYEGLVIELEDVCERGDFLSWSVFLFLHVDSPILKHMIKNINEVFLYSQLPTGLIPPLSEDELAVIMDRDFIKPQRVSVTTLYKVPLKAATD